MHGFVYSVAEILGRPGEYRDLQVHEPLPGVSIALARLDGGPVDARLRVESVMEGVLVTGTVEADARLECARCLRSFQGRLAPRLCELFAAPGHVEPTEDSYRVTGTEIDLEPMLRDALVLALPLKPLCAEDCAGLCARCGRELATGACGCAEDDTDPRWAALAGLRDQLEKS